MLTPENSSLNNTQSSPGNVSRYLGLAGLGAGRTGFFGVDLCWTRMSRPAMMVSATEGGAGSTAYGG